MGTEIKSIPQLCERVLSFDNVLILTHISCDGDTLGSACSLALALRSIGKKVNVANCEKIPKRYRYMTDLVPDMDFEVEKIMTVDVADLKLLGKEFENLYADKIDLAIDHHGTNRCFAKELYLEAESASCTEIIYLLLKEMKAKITKDIADCIFTGCSTDTGCFKFSNVTSRTHIIAAELIEAGANAAWINEVMFDTKSFSQLKLQALCLDGMEMHFENRLLILTITQKMFKETGCLDSDIDFIVAFSRQVEGVEIGITLKEKTDGSFKASLRTNKNIDAAEFCKKFGGGGHAKAAGCSFECSLDDAKAQLIEHAKSVLGA